MPKAAISSKAFLIEGGCNACGLQNTETFTIHFEDQRSAVLDHFDVPSLVQVIAQKNGWREKANEVIKPVYFGDQISYQKGNERIQMKQRFNDNDVLFEQVNSILVQLFKLEPYEIKIAVE